MGGNTSRRDAAGHLQSHGHAPSGIRTRVTGEHRERHVWGGNGHGDAPRGVTRKARRAQFAHGALGAQRSYANTSRTHRPGHTSDQPTQRVSAHSQLLEGSIYAWRVRSQVRPLTVLLMQERFARQRGRRPSRHHPTRGSHAYRCKLRRLRGFLLTPRYFGRRTSRACNAPRFRGEHTRRDRREPAIRLTGRAPPRRTCAMSVTKVDHPGIAVGRSTERRSR
jgi:hypothetical protein